MADATQFLLHAASGRAEVVPRLTELVYQELRKLAATQLKRERADHTLQPTALVHEAYVRLVDQDRIDWQGRTHFLALAANTMRRLLVNHAEARWAKKRGGERDRVTLAGLPVGQDAQPIDLLDFECALAELGEQYSQALCYRFYGGLSVAETAAVMSISERSVRRDVAFARAWLQRRLRSDEF